MKLMKLASEKAIEITVYPVSYLYITEPGERTAQPYVDGISDGYVYYQAIKQGLEGQDGRIDLTKATRILLSDKVEKLYLIGQMDIRINGTGYPIEMPIFVRTQQDQRMPSVKDLYRTKAQIAVQNAAKMFTYWLDDNSLQLYDNWNNRSITEELSYLKHNNIALLVDL